MFDNLYENIGGKIKNLAKWTFIVETISAFLIGFGMIINDGDSFIFGALIIIFGPVIAWVSSWILYAFGELVEKNADNENNTRQILKKLDKDNTNTIPADTNCKITPETENSPTSQHKWLCDGCGNMRAQSPCEHCGKE